MIWIAYDWSHIVWLFKLLIQIQPCTIATRTNLRYRSTEPYKTSTISSNPPPKLRGCWSSPAKIYNSSGMIKSTVKYPSFSYFGRPWRRKGVHPHLAFQRPQICQLSLTLYQSLLSLAQGRYVHAVTFAERSWRERESALLWVCQIVLRGIRVHL